MPVSAELARLLRTTADESHEHDPARACIDCPECIRRASIQAEYILAVGGPRGLLEFVDFGGYAKTPRLLALVALEMGRRLRPPSTAGTPPAYVCPTCGRASWHPEDGRNKFCGVCGFEADRRRP